LNYNLYVYNHGKAIALSQQKSCYISILDDKRRENSRYIVCNDNEIKRENVIANNQNRDRYVCVCVYFIYIYLFKQN